MAAGFLSKNISNVSESCYLMYLQVDESQTGEPGWLAGELKGKTGWFPANYAEKIPDNEVPTSAKPVVDTTVAPKVSLRETPPTPAAPALTESTATTNNWADFSSTYVCWWLSLGVQTSTVDFQAVNLCPVKIHYISHPLRLCQQLTWQMRYFQETRQHTVNQEGLFIFSKTELPS